MPLSAHILSPSGIRGPVNADDADADADADAEKSYAMRGDATIASFERDLGGELEPPLEMVRVREDAEVVWVYFINLHPTSSLQKRSDDTRYFGPPSAPLRGCGHCGVSGRLKVLVLVVELTVESLERLAHVRCGSYLHIPSSRLGLQDADRIPNCFVERTRFAASHGGRRLVAVTVTVVVAALSSAQRKLSTALRWGVTRARGRG
ncbi:hypothetical protein G7Y89_g14441 [Cudoniella acicularis]|uniref:Uncharacterized protein n=1 Tax=Cudoniella acicularis TaxID=354080 RepID=A0A8H4R1Z1_9HELO|nr:hypothetical protein G7Y89_g14441 [Cudoniella acicularis]